MILEEAFAKAEAKAPLKNSALYGAFLDIGGMHNVTV